MGQAIYFSQNEMKCTLTPIYMVKCPLKFQSNASCHAVCLITPNKIPQHKNERKCTLTPISRIAGCDA